MKLSKKKNKEINAVSFALAVMRSYNDGYRIGAHWVDTPPENWNKGRAERVRYDDGT